MHASRRRYDVWYYNLKNILKTESPTIVEIGANNGGDAGDFLYHFKEPQIYCFEPDPDAISVFKSQIKDNKKCKLFEVAVSDKNEEINFNKIKEKNSDNINSVPDKYEYMNLEEYRQFKGTVNSSLSGLELNDNEILETIKVKTITLDDWNEIYKLTDVDYLEIDVQGGEEKVLRGAKEFLRIVKNIKIEYGERRYNDSISREKTIEMLNEYNFVLNTKLSSTGESGDLFFSLKNK